MYRVIEINPKYEISDDGKIKIVGKEFCDLQIKENKVLINLDGYNRWWDLMWLANLVHSKPYFSSFLIDNLKYINFVKVNNPTRTNYDNIINGYIMVFSKPIYYKTGYRIVPGYTFTAVSNDGKLINIKSGKNVEPKSYDNYIYYYTGNHSIRANRAVALAWVNNKDQTNYLLVNHKNGIKTDNNHKNLEWSDFAGNNKHAVLSGLTTTAAMCRVRDIKSGEILEFSSKTDMCAFLGLTASNLLENFKRRSVKLLFKDKYEVRVENDNRPWFYLNRDEPVKNGKYKITVDNDGTIMEFHHTTDFIKYYRLSNLVRKGIYELVEVVKRQNPFLQITVEGYAGPYKLQAKNLKTNIITTFESINDASRKLNINSGLIGSAIRFDDNRFVKGYVFRRKSNKPWQEDVYYPVTNKPIYGYNVETKQRKVFTSVRSTAKYFDCDRDKVRNHIRKNTTLNNWLLSYTEDSPYEQ